MYVDDGLWRRFRVAALLSGKNASDIVEQLIGEWLDRSEGAILASMGKGLHP